MSQYTVKKVDLLEDQKPAVAPAMRPETKADSEKEKEDQISAAETNTPQPALFEETANTDKEKSSPKAKKTKPPAAKGKKNKPKDDGKGGYDIGTTIELDF